jgi:acyl CoA:acetate/3-ketoacid CoA transferase beta subunit
MTVDPSSNLVYGGSATIDISINGSTSGVTANLFTYCTQNGTTWLENSQGIMGSGIKGYESVAVVDLPSAGTYEYDWTSGAASCQSELYVYMWQGSRVTGTSVIGSVQFDVAASERLSPRTRLRPDPSR